MDETKAQLRSRLADYDGKAVSILGEAEAAHSGDEGYLDALIALVEEREGHIANGASWLIKSALERGGNLSLAQMDRLIALLPALEHWAAQLHICQSIRLLDVPENCAAPLAHWLGEMLDHERPFVRAWSLDALGSLAQEYPEHRTAFNAALRSANEDAAAAVRARARHLKPM